MSSNYHLVPIYSYPGGMSVDVSSLPFDDNFNAINYKFVNHYTGSNYLLDGPVYNGLSTINEISDKSTIIHGGVMSTSPSGLITIEYH